MSFKNGKKFSFKYYDVIAFDLDCTVIRWNIANTTPLIIESLRQFLVEQKFYPRCILDFEINIDYIQKGLILDTEKGNLLKLSNDGTILRATHGTKCLTQQQIINIYGEDRKWDIAMVYFEDPASALNGLLSLKLHLLQDYFDFMIGWIFAQLIDLTDKQALENNYPKPEIYNVYIDILDAIKDMYSRYNFYDGRSLYFTRIRAEPERYLYKTSTTIINWLKELRKARKFLALITGSQLEFADFVATYALGTDYRSLFDIVVFHCEHPAFFAEQKRFLRVQEMMELSDSEICLANDLELNCSYANGNWMQLVRTFAHKSGKSLSKIRSLYVGDNHLLDVYTPKVYCGTDSVAICEELIAEKGVDNPCFVDREYVSSNFWGSYLHVDSHPTCWMQVISEHSEICTPFLEYLAELPITHIFVTKKPGGFYV